MDATIYLAIFIFVRRMNSAGKLTIIVVAVLSILLGSVLTIFKLQIKNEKKYIE